jgi:hypothetical protein
MKNIPLFENFVNESVDFSPKGIINKLKDKLVIAKQAVEIKGWTHKVYTDQIERLEHKISTKDVKLDWKNPIMVQGSDPSDDYEIFKSSNATELAKRISKVIKKYKKYEVEATSVGAAAGWSGTARSTVSGFIRGECNFRPDGQNNFLIAVKIGGGISSSIADKIKSELYPLFFVLDEYCSNDGGVSFDETSGTNYSTIGLKCSKFQFNTGLARDLENIMNT